jgi:S-adenosylmethionine:tRNA ribosyltransferase-isomerase
MMPIGISRNMAAMQPGDFFYDLPTDLIAQHPLPNRTSSRLLELDRPGVCRDLQFTELPELFQAGDLLVLNDTRVVPGRLFGHKATGGKIEMLLERCLGPDLALVQLKSSHSPVIGAEIGFEGGATAKVVARRGEFFELQFSGALDEILDAHGHIPLPPYIKRADEIADRDRYQTVFARHAGAVAAPTAGLHFDRGQLDHVRSQGVDIAYLTLHVGAGTFQPLRKAQMVAGKLHAERVDVSGSLCTAINATRARGGRVIAIGTTTVRGLETAALAGTGGQELQPFRGETELFIMPGFEFRVVDSLLTNFHLPESSLLMLVCAFAGASQVMGAYAHAVNQNYRFFSYGDAMFCHRQKNTDR